MDQVFNELSANGCYDDIYSANDGMESLVNLSRALSNIGFSNKLCTVEDFRQLLLTDEYTIQNWVTDRKVGADRDLQRWLLTSTTKSPYIEALLEKEQRSHRVFEFKYDEKQCYGFGLAYLSDCGAVSLNGDPRFSQPEVAISFFEIGENYEVNKSISVNSIYSLEQLGDVKADLAKRNIEKVKNGRMLVKQMPVIFPYLVVAGHAENQIESLSGSEQYFSDILRHFEVLNETMAEWQGGRFEPQGIEWSTESESTLNQFSKCRTFFCKDDTVRLFSLHSKIRGANQRIHFYPITEHKLVHIGYVGKHLPTSNHRT